MFKSWIYRFAEFVDGSPHLTEEEVMTYSTWSSEDEDRRYTDLPDDLFEEMTDDEEVVIELGHRFWCSLCAPLQPGHRFTCRVCAFHSKGEVLPCQSCLKFTNYNLGALSNTYFTYFKYYILPSISQGIP